LDAMPEANAGLAVPWLCCELLGSSDGSQQLPLLCALCSATPMPDGLRLKSTLSCPERLGASAVSSNGCNTGGSVPYYLQMAAHPRAKTFTHARRRGHAQDSLEKGASLGEILRAGEWRCDLVGVARFHCHVGMGARTVTPWWPGSCSKHTSTAAGPTEGPPGHATHGAPLVRSSLDWHQKCTWAVGLHRVSVPLCTSDQWFGAGWASGPLQPGRLGLGCAS